MAESDQAVAFGLAGGFVDNDDSFLQFAVGGEDGAQAVGGGLTRGRG